MLKRVAISIILVLITAITATGYASAISSNEFYDIDGDVFDDWQICRTRAGGQDGFYQLSETGFRPAIAFESLGDNSNSAYSLGEQFIQKYPDDVQRAEKIFYFARDRVRYTPDIDQFEYEEFAQNADEVATSINKNGLAHGDCEDSAVLLAVMYKGAGYRSAIVVGPGHTAALVHLPNFSKTSSHLELDNEPGWVWAEATGSNNKFGWMPKEFINVKLAAYEISDETITPEKPVSAPSIAIAGNGKSTSFSPLPFTSIIALLWIISLFRRSRS